MWHKVIVSLFFHCLTVWLFYCLTTISPVSAATVGLHNVQWLGTEQILQRESGHQSTIPIIGLIFDKYQKEERNYLTNVVSALGTGRIYHISLSPFGHTAAEVRHGIYDKEYALFFEDMKKLNIKVIFRTMHEMNGGRYSRSSHPDDFQIAWRHVWKLARKTYDLQSDKLLFSLSFNSQDLPTIDERPTQESPIRFCSQREIDHQGRCPRKADYYPGDKYVDLIGVTLYNRWRSRPDKWSKWKTPSQLRAEDDLGMSLLQRRKPIIIDELGTTAVNFKGKWSIKKVQRSFIRNTADKNKWLGERKSFLAENLAIRAIVYFNLDATEGQQKQVGWQADRSIILSRRHADYDEGVNFLTKYNNTKSIQRLFRVKKK